MKTYTRYSIIACFVIILCGCHPRPTAEDYRANARQKYKHGDYAGAVTDYSEVISLKPDDLEAHVQRGLARARLGDFEGGISDCTSAIRLQPNSRSGYSSRGSIRHMKGDESGAIADFTQAIAHDPSSPYAYFNRAVSQRVLRNYREAVSDLTECIRLSKTPKDLVPAFSERAANREALGDHEGAIEDSNQAALLKARAAVQ
jgi:tetratricopeptide (TPR) repeat protein